MPSDLLLGFLDGSPFENDLDEIVKSFDRSTKLRFKTAEGFQYIKFGGSRDNDPAHNIRLGQLKLPGSVLSQNMYSNVPKNANTGLTWPRSLNPPSNALFKPFWVRIKLPMRIYRSVSCAQFEAHIPQLDYFLFSTLFSLVDSLLATGFLKRSLWP